MPRSSPEQTPANKPPADKFNDGPVHVSIWEHGGPRHAFRLASFELRYQDRHRQWKTGHNYSGAALKHLESAAKEARTRIDKWKQDRQTPSAAPKG